MSEIRLVAHVKRLNIRAICLSLLLCGVRTSPAQEPLSLEQCIDLALRHNLQHLHSHLKLRDAQARLQQALAPFEIRADADFRLPSFNESRDTQESVALVSRFREETTNFTYAGNLRISQRVPHIGLLTFTSSAFRQDFSSNVLTDFLEYFGAANFGFTHEIFTRPQEEIVLEQARLDLDQAEIDFAGLEMLLEHQVAAAYYDLVRNIRKLEIEELQLNQSRSSLELARRKFEIGLVAEVQPLRLEVAALQAEASLARAQTAIELSRDVLRQILGMEFHQPLEVVTEVDSRKYPISQARALEVGLKQRTDLKQAAIMAEISKLGLHGAERLNGATARLVGNLSMSGRGPEIGAISTDLERNLWSVGIEVNLPLVDNGLRRGRLHQARVAVRQNQLARDQVRQNVIREIREAVLNLKEAERQIDLTQAALTVAERAYQVEQSRFELGLIQSQDLLTAQANLTGSRVSTLDALVNYQLHLQKLRLVTMADLSQMLGMEETGNPGRPNLR